MLARSPQRYGKRSTLVYFVARTHAPDAEGPGAARRAAVVAPGT